MGAFWHSGVFSGKLIVPVDMCANLSNHLLAFQNDSGQTHLGFAGAGQSVKISTFCFTRFELQNANG